MKMKGLIGNITKAHGEGTAMFGGDMQDTERVPTSIFAFDLSTGGGFPVGKVSVVYGPESSGKSNLALLAIANYQRRYPEQVAVFLDIENSFDAIWAKRLGVDTDALAVLRPAFAEEAIDMTSGVLEAEDSGIIVVDSVAALTPTKEAESSAERQQVAGSSLLVGSMMRKAIVGMGQAQRKGQHKTLILINQIRQKVGVMFGNPEGMPGGHALKHASGLTVRVYGKNKVIKEVSPTMPAAKETHTVVTKWKVPIVSINAEYDLAMIPHKGLQIGQTDEWNTLSNYLRDMGLLVKGEKTGWDLDGKNHKTLADAKAALLADPEGLHALKQHIINAQIQVAYGEGPQEIVDGEA